MSNGIVRPSDILSKLSVEAQTSALSNKLQGIALPTGTPDAKLRVGYVTAFDPMTWTCSAMIGDQLTEIPSIQVLGHVQPMIDQAGLFVQAGGDKSTQYTMVGVLTQGSTGGASWRIRKSADQAVTNSATLGPDTHLNFYAQSERSYIFETQLFVRQNSAVDTLDFNVGWILPAGATYTIGGTGPATAIVGGNASQASSSGQYRAGVAAVSGDKLSFGIEPATTGGVYDFHTVSIVVSGTITLAATSGLCSVGWCQNVAAAASTQVRAGSWLKVEATSELLP